MERTLSLLSVIAFVACGGSHDTPTPPGTGGAGTPHVSIPAATLPANVPTVGQAPVIAPPPTAAPPGTSSVQTRAPVAATGCPATDAAALAAAGTVHSNTISLTETWDLAGSPHRFPGGAEIQAGVTVTIEPCALVIVGQGDNWIHVNQGATLVAEGQVGRPITFESDAPAGTPSPGRWDGVYLADGAQPATRFHHVIIEDAGHVTGGWPASLAAAGSSVLDVQDVKIENGLTSGVSLHETAKFAPGSAGLVITKTGSPDPYSPPVVIQDPTAVASLPAGTYTGNVNDEICVLEENMRVSGTWRNPGVRYRLKDDLTIGSTAGATLTLAPGVTLAFEDDHGLFVGYSDDGAIVFDGQAEATRIILTSASLAPEPGKWGGLWFGDHVLRPLVKVSYVTVRFAGGNESSRSGTCGGVGKAAIYIGYADLGPRIDHTRVEQTPPDAFAVLRSYNNATPTDYAAPALNNDFSQSGTSCKQNVVPDGEGDCPASPVCH